MLDGCSESSNYVWVAPMNARSLLLIPFYDSVVTMNREIIFVVVNLSSALCAIYRKKLTTAGSCNCRRATNFETNVYRRPAFASIMKSIKCGRDPDY